MVELFGFYQRHIYSNGEYSVAVFADATTGDSFKVCGEGIPTAKKIKYHFIGEMQTYKKTGEQTLKMSDYEIAELDNETSFVEYLAMPPIKLGRLQGKKIYRLYKENAIAMLDTQPEVVYEAVFKKLRNGEKRFDEFIELWKSQRSLLKITSFLVRYGIKRRDVVKLNDAIRMEKYDSLGEAIRSNPYFLMNVQGVHVDISVCDEIAKKMQFPLNSPERIKAGMKYVLRRAMLQGDMFMYCFGQRSLVEEVSVFLSVAVNEVAAVLNTRPDGFVLEKDKQQGNYRIYLDYAHDWESGLAKSIFRIITKSIEPIMPEKEINKFIENYQKEKGIELAEKQKEAIRTVSNSVITIITGGAGTGKTTSLNAILAMLHAVGMDNNCLLASTGKASQRMSEATGYPATTIHSCIACDDNNDNGCSYSHDIICDALVVDEFSMTDCRVAYLLFSAITDCERIIIVGDVEQLPSVGAGNVLRDMITSGRISVVALDVIQRQALDSPIVCNAQKILRGENDLVINDKFRFIHLSNPAEAGKYIVNRYVELVKEYGLNYVQILSPMKKRDGGTIKLNEDIQEKLLPTIKKERFRLGDKVMNTKNKHDLDLNNGDIGYITKISDGEYTIEFDGERTITFSSHEMDSVVLAYAITVHKSQGCEFPYVIMPILDNQDIMLFRNLLYTGVTRAKVNIELVGSEEMLRKAIDTVKIADRKTTLAKRLQFADVLCRPKKKKQTIEDVKQMELPGVNKKIG